MAAHAPSGTNTFIPQFDTRGKLIISYSRNPDSFAVNKYVTITPVTKNLAWYLEITPDVAARLSDTMNELAWPDNQEDSGGEENLADFEFKQVATKRLRRRFAAGDLAVDQADFDLIATNGAFAAQLMMTARTLAALNVLLTSGNYAASHVASATTSGGGFWDAGTSIDPIIKTSLNYFRDLILQDTLGMVEENALRLLISPTVAFAMARSAEIHDYLKGSPDALRQLIGQTPGQNDNYSLPRYYAGFEIVVEKTYRVTSGKGAATRTGEYVMDDNKAVICARPGALVQAGGTVSFSTVHQFFKEEMTVETKKDVDNRRTVGRIVEDYGTYMVAPATGALITGILS